jgi:hypothetical protein
LPRRFAYKNFHAASYLGTNLAVVTRTVNETNAVVAAIKALLDKQARAMPLRARPPR